MQAKFLLVLTLLPLAAFAQNPATSLPEAPHPAVLQPTPDPRWEAVEELTPGESIEVRNRASGSNTQCLLDYVDNTLLACSIAEPNGQMRRVIFPHAAVSRIWVTRVTRDTHSKGILIATAIGAGIGAFLGGQAGVRGAFVGILFGGGFVAGIATLNDEMLPRYVPRRRLIYATL